MSTLTDRYVWAVLRSVPADQRNDLEPEIRALVGDAVEARRAGATDAGDASAERDALVELGDPEILAARYTDRSLVLLGPSVFLPWRRLLTVLVPLVAAIAGIVAAFAAALDGREVSGLVGVGISAGIAAAIQTVFWVTLVFVVIERFARSELDGHRWTPDALPDTPVHGRRDATELITAVATAGIAAGALVWQSVARPIGIDGTGYPLIDPALWSSWLPLLVAVLVAEMVLAVVSYVRGRWTWTYAAINAVLALAFAVPAVWLLQTGQLLDPGLAGAIRDAGHGEALQTILTIVAFSIIGVTAWEIADGFLRARRWQQGVTSGERAAPQPRSR